MSRIHEALAKAVRDKEKQGSASLSPALVEIATGVHQAPSFEDRFDITVAPQAEKPQVPIERLTEIEKGAQLKWKLDPRINVFLPESKQKIAAERFRTLRSRLYQISEARKLRTVLVTSGVPSEGKSFVCANLAQSLVHRQDRKVLLIDADMRLPTQHKIFGAPKTPGLTNYLRDEVDERQVLQKGMDSNVFLIPAGDEVKNPSELLLSERMRGLIKFGAEEFDWVILDSPPTLPVHDSSVLADLCDGVLLVVRAASTDFEMAGKAADEFREKNLLGVVFNYVEKDVSPYVSYY
jgi:capsular exopolysaccharide synthesis family protein